MLAYLPPPEVPGAISTQVTQANIQSTICVPGYTAKVRPPQSYTYPIKKKLAKAAGVDLHLYELDHLVPIELGGDPSNPKNLWLEPWNGPWNAHIKDKLENALHDQVCGGRTTLLAAQNAFMHSWVAAYIKVFQGS